MQFAVKLLRKSDLTFFEVQFRKLGLAAAQGTDKLSKQKAINLNTDVFIDVAFPAVRPTSGSRRFNLPLTIYGPGLRNVPHTITRKVVAPGAGGKNWRLNGELVSNPDFDQDRYDGLQSGDLALFGLEGILEPSAISLVLISQSDPNDNAMYAALKALLGNRSMTALSTSELEEIVSRAPVSHPIRDLIDPALDEVLEEAAVGSAEAVKQLRSRYSPRRMTAEAFQKAREDAEATGYGGELLINGWFAQRQKTGGVSSFDWMSDGNSIHPWDFEYQEGELAAVRVEVKTTKGGFDRPIHISQAEIAFAADPDAPRTDLYRLFEFDGRSAKLTICKDIRAFAKSVLDAGSGLPAGTTPDGYTVRVESIGDWTNAELITMPQDDDAD